MDSVLKMAGRIENPGRRYPLPKAWRRPVLETAPTVFSRKWLARPQLLLTLRVRRRQGGHLSARAARLDQDKRGIRLELGRGYHPGGRGAS